ncbi:MAG TPA: HAD family hydrolase [Holophagaceae bacterium]|nr:HAD family hydrolase [Holophagaceae bacterium]
MKLVVFDFDGTLVDSRPLIEAGMRHALDALGLPHHHMEAWLDCVGLPVETGIQRTFGPLGLTVEEVLPAYRSFGHADHEHLIRPFEGMDALLADLEAVGIPKAIATSKRRLPLLRQLDQFGWRDRFDPIITPDEVTHGKPHPESLELIQRLTGHAPTDLLMVGDTSFDLEMAQRGGVPSVAVGHGHHAAEVLAGYAPRAYAPDTAALRDILLALGA